MGWSWQDLQATPASVRAEALALLRETGEVGTEEPGILVE